MNGQQLNARISAIAGAEADYVGDWIVLLQLTERLGYEVCDTSRSRKQGWKATVSKAGLCVQGTGATLNHATCEALLKLEKVIRNSRSILESGEIQFRGESASISVALMWLSEGLIVSRREWHSSHYLTLTRGSTPVVANGIDMYGVPSALFDGDPQQSFTAMPRIIQHNRELLTTIDWSPTINDLLAHDWRLF